ncbi:MAG: protein kinase domain-containing protein [Bryobacteraceae bacterium]
MRVPNVLGEGGRYQIEGEVGRGGMGAVYRAVDRNTGQYVAVKAMLDASDPEILALFDKEWRILVELQHTNIIGISDRGQFRDGSVTYPYFVMPFLRGKTLQERIAESGFLPTAEVAGIVGAVSAGLHAAHIRGVIHRDVKPSNIFILDSGSVVIIDFGIVHVGDTRTISTLKGTTPYMAPELLDPQKLDKPTPQSDIFALGVVSYEALTGVRPFARPTADETIRAILKEIPKPAYELNRAVSLGVGQVIQKAMAKDKSHRYKTVIEFAERLQRASRGEALPEFDRQMIEDRLRVVREALSKGMASSASEVLRGIEEEGYVDPSITSQREKIDQILQRNWIRTQLESVRLYREAKEYDAAIEKLAEVLHVMPDNPDALAERDLIDQERLSKVLGQARQCLEKHDFAEARKGIEQARQIDAQDTQTSELLSELTRLEEADRALAAQKELLYQEALSTNRDGYLRAALQRLEKLVELTPSSGASTQSERDIIYARFHEELLQEYGRVQKAGSEAKTRLAKGKLSEVSAICAEMLTANQGNAVFLALKLEAERRDRELRLEYLRQLSERLSNLPDLDERVKLAQEALTAYPGESQLAELLRHARESRDLVNSLIAQARIAEDCQEFSEALDRWRTVEEFHPAQPGLALELARVEKRLADQVRAARKSGYTEEIWRLLRSGDYERALDLCGSGLEAFPGDGELLVLQSETNERLKRGVEVKALVNEGRALLHSRDADAALETLRRAYEIDRNDPQARQFLGAALLAKAQVLLESEWKTAEKLLIQAKELIPHDPALKGVALLVADRKQREDVELSLTKAWRLVLAGDLRGALGDIDTCLARYPSDRRLLAERRKILLDLGENIPTPTPGVKSPSPGPPAERPAPSDGKPQSPELEPALEPAPPPPGTAGMAGMEPPAEGAGGEAARSPLGEAPPLPTTQPEVRAWATTSENSVGDSRRELNRRSWAARLAGNRLLLAGVLLLTGIPLIWVAYERMHPPSPPPPVLTQLQITSTPGAEIAVDGKKKGTSPRAVELSPGTHTITASLRGYLPRRESVTAKGGPQAVDLELQPELLTLHVSTDQAKGTVRLDDQTVSEISGNDVGFPGIQPGKLHTVKFENASNGSTVSASFQFSPGELPSVVDLPQTAPAMILFMGFGDGKMRAQCNRAAVRLTIGDQHATVGTDGTTLDLPNGDHIVEVDAAGLKPPQVKVSTTGEPSAAVGFYWGGPRAAPPASASLPSSVDLLLASAEQYKAQRSFADADRLVGEVLKREPENQRALKLKQQLDTLNNVIHWRKPPR